MATQGLVTVVNADKKVLMKIVVGCDGHSAKKVATKLKKAWPLDEEAAYKIASRAHFGSQECRVVITESNILYKGDDEESMALYRNTFQQPEFNPRWELGTAEFTIVVQV